MVTVTIDEERYKDLLLAEKSFQELSGKERYFRIEDSFTVRHGILGSSVRRYSSVKFISSDDAILLMNDQLRKLEALNDELYSKLFMIDHQAKQNTLVIPKKSKSWFKRLFN